MNGERSTADHAEANKPRNRTLAGLIRRMVVTLASGARWQLRGFKTLRELANDVEVFQGIGIFARPPDPESPARATVEAVVLNLGDSDAPIVVAVRDARTQAAVAAALEADTTILYNSLVGVKLTRGTGDGEIVLASHNGGFPRSLAFLAALTAIKTAIGTITPATDLASAITAVNAILTAFGAWSPSGTTKVRAE